MSRLLVLALLVSAFVVYGFNTTLMAASQTEESRILIKCTTCGVEFTSPALWKEHLEKHPDHKAL